MPISELPPCWEGYSNGTSAGYMPHVTDGSTYSYSISGNALTLTSGSATYGDVKFVRLPRFAMPVSTLTMSYSMGDYQLTWIPGYQETSWDVDYREQGTSTWTTLAIGTSNTSLTILSTDLTSNTHYEFRVTAICSDTNLSTSVALQMGRIRI